MASPLPSSPDSNAEPPATCPVDHKSREAWLQHARAAGADTKGSQHPPTPPHPPHPAEASQTPSKSWTQSLVSLTPFSSSAPRSSEAPSTTTTTPTSSPSAAVAATTTTTSTAAVEACPVDHKSREAWLSQARAAAAKSPRNPPETPNPPVPTKSQQPSRSWTQSLLSYIPFTTTSSSSTTSTSNSSPKTPAPAPAPNPGLDTYREVSTIPRTTTSAAYPGNPPAVAGSASASTSASSHALPSNNEQETGADEATGNWIYPSEKMFFDAMKRKGHDTRAADMATVVPIHNAVNERAWKEIKEWERPYTEGTACDGPRLHSFAGLSTNMSPKARINTLLGYTAPFDRHDWVVDRCGVRVEYVIDFYAGRPDAARGMPSFYLDVRPKLNSWEGVKMRALRGVGLT